MKNIRNRVIYVTLLVWGFLGTMFQFDKIKRLIAVDAGISPVASQFKISIIWVVVFITFALTVLLVYKKKSGTSWRLFLFEEIDQLDEDERSILIDAPARRFAGNIMILVVLLFLSLMMMGPISIQSNTIIGALGLLFTIYELCYYFKLRHLYYK